MGLTLASAAPAQYSIDWYTMDSGGGSSSGGIYAITGTIGQTEADPLSLCSPDGGPGCLNPTYEITGGYWAGIVGPCAGSTDCIFKNGFEPEL